MREYRYLCFSGDLFLFTHLTVEVSVFIYLFIAQASPRGTRSGTEKHTGYARIVSYGGLRAAPFSPKRQPVAQARSGAGFSSERFLAIYTSKLTRAQYLDEVTWTTKSWLGLKKQRI